jgi:hypothetical protein
VILITHIEPVREGLDRVITVAYDADNGSSIVTQGDKDEVAVGDDVGPRGGERPGRVPRTHQEDFIQSAEAGAGAAS